MKLVLFDIDGTLLWTDGAGRRAIQRALVDEAGTAGPIDTYRFDGKTDPQIVQDLLSLAGHAGAENASVIRAVCRRYVDHLRTELERPAQTTRLMVGIADLLAALEPHEAGRRALVGLLTGNVAPGADLKLRSAGLDPARFCVGAYGSDSARRGCHRLLRRRRAASDGRGLRVRDAGEHGPRPRRHLRVSRPLLSSMSPADELEVKARVDDPDGLRAALVRAGASLDFRGDMIDRRFDQGGSLAQRNEVLRLREFRAADGTPAYGVLGWKGPPSLRGLYRHRAEAEARVATPDSVVTILEQLGFTVSLRIDRRVEVYRLGHAVLRLEWYPAMDVLLEVEGEPPAIERAIAATGLARDRFLPESLPYFVSQYEARTGRAALLAR